MLPTYPLGWTCVYVCACSGAKDGSSGLFFFSRLVKAGGLEYIAEPPAVLDDGVVFFQASDYSNFKDFCCIPINSLPPSLSPRDI